MCLDPFIDFIQRNIDIFVFYDSIIVNNSSKMSDTLAVDFRKSLYSLDLLDSLDHLDHFFF